MYEVSSADLADERWTLRAWHADRWLRAAGHRFATGDIEAARPDLWAADDPSVDAAGTDPDRQRQPAGVRSRRLPGERRATPLRRPAAPQRRPARPRPPGADRLPVPDEPGPAALAARAFATTPGDLSDLLLLDVEAGLREKASRIEEAITAAQSFIRRSRLGLEPGWKVTREFARLWDSRFETYRTWQRARRRELYRENWIEWEELDRARRIEAFRFLESQLRASTLTLAAPGGLDWWPDDAAGTGTRTRTAAATGTVADQRTVARRPRDSPRSAAPNTPPSRPGWPPSPSPVRPMAGGDSGTGSGGSTAGRPARARAAARFR